MSLDYSVICHRCKKYTHLGQIGEGHASFAFGSGDLTGHTFVMCWIGNHEEHGVEIRIDEAVPDGYVNIEHSDIDEDGDSG